METRRERFLRKVRTTAAIEEAGVPAVFDTGADPSDGEAIGLHAFMRRLAQYLDGGSEAG
ncbi:hypothetical protein [Actinomadura napierensis]|uniref:Uncharacterized protein n=1 Tax=Actinomadura napierensis TaxID=267854 RepID=A0ABN2ZZE0_9ACTN